MAETEQDDRVERKVVYENVSTSTTRNNTAAMIIIAIVALSLIVFILMNLR